MQSGNLRVDTVTRKAFLDDKELAVSETEFNVLVILMQHQGQALSRQWLFENVDGVENIRIVDYYIKWLRGKIETGIELKRIITVRGVGYRFDG